MDSHASRVVTHWALTARDPLVPEVRRFSAAAAMQRLVVDSSPARDWMLGVLADQMTSLPPDDPWVTGDAQAGTMTRGRPPGHGAWVDGMLFGTTINGLDLVGGMYGQPELDPELTALAEDLDLRSGVLLMFAADGWLAAGNAAVELRIPDEQWFDVAADAIRWASWRRRQYVGHEDSLWHTSLTGWLDAVRSTPTWVVSPWAEHARVRESYEAFHAV